VISVSLERPENPKAWTREQKPSINCNQMAEEWNGSLAIMS